MITRKNIRYFNFAKEAAKFSDFNMHHLGCVVVYKSHILSTGFNTNRTHPIQMEYNKYRNFNNPNNVKHKLHAEIMGLSKIRYLNIDWNKVEIYIYRENKDRSKALSYPCIGCKQYIKDLGIKNIYFTGNDSYCYEKL